MGDHARGDCKKIIYSSEEEEIQQEVYHNSLHFNPTPVVMMSQLNICDKRIPVPGTSGEAPAVPVPPTADDTDRQFWAEDEMSSSESRLRLVSKKRRRHSLAYRNRVANRKRSRSLLCQSSSSNSDPAVDLKIVSPIRYIARRRRKCNHRVQGPSVTKKSKAGNNGSAFRTSTPRPSIDSKISNSSTAGTGRIQFGIQQPNSRRRMQAPCIPGGRRRSRSRRSQTPSLPCSSNFLSMNNGSFDIDEFQNENLRPPPTSKRK